MVFGLRDWIEAQYAQFACAGPDQSQQHADGGGFPGAVWPQPAKNLPWMNMKANPVDRSKFAKTLGQFFGNDGIGSIWPGCFSGIKGLLAMVDCLLASYQADEGLFHARLDYPHPAPCECPGHLRASSICFWQVSTSSTKRCSMAPYVCTSRIPGMPVTSLRAASNFAGLNSIR